MAWSGTAWSGPQFETSEAGVLCAFTWSTANVLACVSYAETHMALEQTTMHTIACLPACSVPLCLCASVPVRPVNNAGTINDCRSRLWEIPATDFHRVMAVNLEGQANVIRHFVPLMLGAKEGRGGGAIINISSAWGRTGGEKARVMNH